MLDSVVGARPVPVAPVSVTRLVPLVTGKWVGRERPDEAESQPEFVGDLVLPGGDTSELFDARAIDKGVEPEPSAELQYPVLKLPVSPSVERTVPFGREYGVLDPKNVEDGDAKPETVALNLPVLEDNADRDEIAAGLLDVVEAPDTDGVHAPLLVPVVPVRLDVLVKMKDGDGDPDGAVKPKPLDGVLPPLAVWGEPEVELLIPGAGKGVAAEVGPRGVCGGVKFWLGPAVFDPFGPGDMVGVCILTGVLITVESPDFSAVTLVPGVSELELGYECVVLPGKGNPVLEFATGNGADDPPVGNTLPDKEAEGIVTGGTGVDIQVLFVLRVVSGDAEDVTPDSHEDAALAETFVAVWARDVMPDAGSVGVEGGWVTLESAFGVLLRDAEPANGNAVVVGDPLLLTPPVEFVPNAVDKLVCLDTKLVGALLVALSEGVPLTVEIPDWDTSGDLVVVADDDADAMDPEMPDDPFCPLVVVCCNVDVLVWDSVAEMLNEAPVDMAEVGDTVAVEFERGNGVLALVPPVSKTLLEALMPSHEET